MSASWIVSVRGRAYGPYSDAQMAAFAAEGRLAPQSLVARKGEHGFHPASFDAALFPLFSPTTSLPAPEPEPVEAAPEAETIVQEEARSIVFGKNKEPGRKNGQRSHMVVFADMKSRSIDGLEEEIHRLGQTYALLPQVWLLRTDQSVTTVRNILVQQLGKLDALFVVDATHNKIAWFNFGPEAEARIRRIWLRPEVPVVRKPAN